MLSFLYYFFLLFLCFANPKLYNITCYPFLLDECLIWYILLAIYYFFLYLIWYILLAISLCIFTMFLAISRFVCVFAFCWCFWWKGSKEVEKVLNRESWKKKCFPLYHRTRWRRCRAQILCFTNFHFYFNLNTRGTPQIALNDEKTYK